MANVENAKKVTQCPICLEDFDGTGPLSEAHRTQLRPCGHIVCKNCLQMDPSRKCGICRASVVTAGRVGVPLKNRHLRLKRAFLKRMRDILFRRRLVLMQMLYNTL